MPGPMLLTGRGQRTGDAGLDAILDAADALDAQDAGRLGGPGASAPIADYGMTGPAPGETEAFIAGLGQDMPAAPPAMTDVPTGPAAPPRRGVLGLMRSRREPAPGDLPPEDLAAIARAETLSDRMQSTPDVRAALASFERQPAPAPHNAPALIEGEVFLDAEGRPVTVGAQGGTGGPAPAPPPRSRVRGGAGAAPAPAQPPTEAELNNRLISELAGRPYGDGPLAPFDFRGESIPEQQARQLADRERFDREQADRAAMRTADTMDREALLEEQRAQVAARRQAALEEGRRRYVAAMERASEMRLEPERFFRSRGVLGQIGAAVAMATGAFAEAFSGAPNRAAQIIDSAVARDLEAQRTDIQQAHSAAEGQRGVLALMRQQYDDEAAAVDAAKAAMLGEAARRAEIEAAQARSEDTRLRAAELRTQLEAQAQAAQESAAMREALAQLEFRRTLAQTVEAEGDARVSLANADRAERRAAGGGGPGRVSAERLAIFDRLVARNVPRDRAARLAGIPDGIDPSTLGEGGEVDPGALERFAQRMQPLVDADVTLRQLEDSVAGDSDISGVGPVAGRLPNFIAGEEGRTVRRRALQVSMALLRAQSGAQVSDQEAERFLQSIGLNPTATEDEWRNGLVELRRRHAAAVNSVQAGFGGPQSPTVRAFERSGGVSGLATDEVRGVTSLRRAR